MGDGVISGPGVNESGGVAPEGIGSGAIGIVVGTELVDELATPIGMATASPKTMSPDVTSHRYRLDILGIGFNFNFRNWIDCAD